MLQVASDVKNAIKWIRILIRKQGCVRTWCFFIQGCVKPRSLAQELREDTHRLKRFFNGGDLNLDRVESVFSLVLKYLPGCSHQKYELPTLLRALSI